ncbi:MAG: proline--tRNA ligase [Myxococcales bacterium]|nr:proline--tRNA ligase [Myxococcales bacterium]
MSKDGKQKQGGQNAGQQAKGAVESAIKPTRAEDYAEWYQQVIRASELAENSVVRGCMVIKPWGYALWERFQAELDQMFKDTGHKNAYFPLFIPKSFLEKEAEHVEGFAKECAIVTHHRLVPGADGGLVPDPKAKLEEPLIVRPTSETIIGASFAQWVRSYRDLPLLINQWANVVRWEMRTRLFLRTAEFLWQEGHTVHATREEAEEETRTMLKVYVDFAQKYLAMPVHYGAKTASERFPGAVDTYSIEAMMQDRKALQAGTSHFLGQNFAKASGIKFQTKNETEELAWTTSWGVSTRLVGAMVMTHADDDGLVIPPKLAPAHAVILPVLRGDETKAAVMEYVAALVKELKEVRFHDRRITVEVDARDIRGGEKNWDWIKKGVPLRIEVGPRDVESGNVVVSRRDKGTRDKTVMSRAALVTDIVKILDEMQDGLFERALAYRKEHSRFIDSRADFEDFFTPKSKNAERPEIHGGFAFCHFNLDEKVEAELREKLKVTIRNVPDDVPEAREPGTCIFTGQPSARRVLFSKAY